MKRRSYQLRVQRRRIFLGGEGDSERNYGALLHNLLNEDGSYFHIDPHAFSQAGGNPVRLVELAIAQIARQKALGRTPYIARALLLDSDKADKTKRTKANKLAQEANIISIWQEPCHEGFLLLHTSAKNKKRPTSSGSAKAQLNKMWNNNYEKAMAAARLRKYISLQDIIQAKKYCEGLAEFLKVLEL